MTEGRYFGIIINTDSILTDGRVLGILSKETVFKIAVRGDE